MRKASLPRKLNEIDERLDKLRKQIKRKADPIAIANTLAAFHFDSIARLRTYGDQLDKAVDCNFFDTNIVFEERVARTSAILRLLRRLQSLSLKQFDHFLKCFGGSQAIAVLQIVRWASEDPVHLDCLATFVASKRSSRRA